MSAPRSLWREVARFELSLQAREFLTWIYVAVFFFLGFGYASSGAVELVSGRGDTYKNAPWAIAHAMAGITAFGQVITTMITATAVMRDVASRTQELLFTTRLTRGDYLGGRYAGALATMALVYLAIPAGLLAGVAMPWVDPASLAPVAAHTYLRPVLLLVLPNVLVVSTLFFAAGALRRGFMAILLLGLALVALWQTGLSLVHDGVMWSGALVDPFGNAALEATTAAWTTSARNATPLPCSPFLVANRLLWGVVAVVAAMVLVRRFAFDLAPSPAPTRGNEPPTTSRVEPLAAPLPRRVSARPGVWRAATEEFRWALAWTLRERGFVTLAALGALNALANALGDGASNAAAILATVQAHARVLLILIATIYAGELVWRDRDVRAHELVDALPLPTAALVGGRIVGILAAELVIVAPLALCALFVGVIRGGGSALDPWLTVRWIFGLVYPFMAQLTLLSLLVHVVVQNKVAGHVLLIVGWVVAVATDRAASLPAWMRYAEPPPFTYDEIRGFGASASLLVWSEVWFSALALACGLLAVLLWVRGPTPSWPDRLRVARQRLAPSLTVGLALAVALAATAARQVAVSR